MKRPPLSRRRTRELEAVAHRATCAYCPWVGVDRPLREPCDADEREHLAACPKNPLLAENERLRKALERARQWAESEGLDEDDRDHARPLWLEDAEVALDAPFSPPPDPVKAQLLEALKAARDAVEAARILALHNDNRSSERAFTEALPRLDAAIASAEAEKQGGAP